MTKTRINADSANDNSISGDRLEDSSVPLSKLESLPPTPGNASDITYNYGSSTVTRSVESRLEDQVSVLDFIPVSLHQAVRDGTNTDDLSSYIQAAINTGGKSIFFPAGTYLCNVFMGNRVLLGEGNVTTLLRPYDMTLAAVTVVISPPYWSGHKEIRNLGFVGPTSGPKDGTGVVLGITDPMEIDVDAGANSNNPQGAKGSFGRPFVQYPQSVKFYGCGFRRLNRGLMFSSGNIGTEVFGCGFQSNNYGVYMLNNKRGGDGMQAGCKYFYGGEMSSNLCAVYMHNNWPINGQISFRDVITEYNRISFYLYNDNGMVCPFTVENMWQEGNGRYYQSQGPVTIDAWVDHPTLPNVQNLTTQTVDPRFMIIDGENGEYVLKESFVGDIDLKAPDARVYITRCRVEGSDGCSGGPLKVFNPTTASITIKDSWSGCGVGGGSISGVYSYDLKWNRVINNAAIGSAFALIGAPHRMSVSNVYPNNRVYSYDFTTPQTIAGSFSLTGSVVSDGVLFSTCNEFTAGSFATNQFLALNGSNFTTTAGYYICTFTAKNVSGGPVFFGMWDRNQNQWFQPISAPDMEGKWVTYASYTYSPGGQPLFFDMRGAGAAATWRLSDLQVLRFDLEQEAINYLSSLSFSHV